MLKKILLFIGLFTSIIINFSNLSAENLILKPLKKPSLSIEEITKKISKNILKPIKKPKESKNIKIKEKKIVEKKKRKKIIVQNS